MMKRNKIVLFFFLAFSISILNVHAATNPYGKYQSLYGITTVRCTWYAWQQAYEHTGVALPGWGNAQDWYNSAINAGYKVGSTAKPNSIVVYSSNDGYGHVGFVVSVEGNIMTVNEAGIVTDENEGIVNGSHKYTTAGNLIGFIYLDEPPTKNNNNNNNNNSLNSNNDKKELSSNTNLSNLSIDIDNFQFDPKITEYQLEVDNETQIINIKAEAEDEKAIVTGTGAKALKVGENNYTIIVTAEDKTTKEYNITIIRNEAIKLDSITRKEEKEIENNTNLITYFIIGIGSLIILIMMIIILKKKRKKRND